MQGDGLFQGQLLPLQSAVRQRRHTCTPRNQPQGIYQQTFIDTYAKVAFAKLYDRKNALVAADMLNDRVIPWYKEQDVPLLRILTDRGTEYCGNREHHEFQLYLAVEDIDHSRIKARSPQTNGICERFHKTLQDEFYSVEFRKKVLTSLAELQADLDAWIDLYNNERVHSGRYLVSIATARPRCRPSWTAGNWPRKKSWNDFTRQTNGLSHRSCLSDQILTSTDSTL